MMIDPPRSFPLVHREPLRTDPPAANVPNGLDAGILICDHSGNILFRNARAARNVADDRTLRGVLGEFRGWERIVAEVFESGSRGRIMSANPYRPRTVVHLGPLLDPVSNEIKACLIRFEEEAGEHVSDESPDVSRRLAVLGKLAARVAHELNNPLDGILRYVNLAIRLAGATCEPKLQTYLSESRTGLMRMVQIIGGLLEFSRKADGDCEPRTVNEIVEESIRTVTARAEDQKIVIAVDFQSSQVPRVRGSRLYQVCCNLLKNAVDAMPSGGRLSITTGVVDDQVILRVSDTGIGLPAEVERLFEPFFTTKPPGQGTGLGLSICKEFIEDMSGTIVAGSSESGGALFTVRIPVASFQTTVSGNRPDEQ